MIPGGTTPRERPKSHSLQQKVSTAIFAAHPTTILRIHDGADSSSWKRRILLRTVGHRYFPGQGKQPKTGSLVKWETRGMEAIRPGSSEKKCSAIVAQRYDGGRLTSTLESATFPTAHTAARPMKGMWCRYGTTRPEARHAWMAELGGALLHLVYNAPMDTYFSPTGKSQAR